MSSLTVRRDGAVAVLTIDRPPANAMDAASLHELADTVAALETDDAVDALVITGAGRSFSAGLDLKSIVDSSAADQEDLIEALNRAFVAVYSCPRRTVAAVNGHAIAGGLVLLLCCDVRLATDGPLRAALAEVRVGVVFPVGAIEVVRGELAPPVARRLALTGAPFDAVEGVELGVFDRIVPAADLPAEALAAANADPTPRDAYAAIKAQLRAAAIERTRAALGGRDPLPRPWLTAETFAAADAALRR